MSSFDQFAQNYDDRLDDPLRQQFANDGDFFIHQKCRALMRHLDRHATGARPLRLLDAGCGQGPALAFLQDQARVFGTDVSLPIKASAGSAPTFGPGFRPRPLRL